MEERLPHSFHRICLPRWRAAFTPTSHLFSRATELVLGPLLLLVITAQGWAKAPFDDPEDSPLFAGSMQKAFAQFAVRDNVSFTARDPARQATPYASDIIVVEGTRWHSLGAGAAPLVPAGGSRKGPVPLSVTTDLTCGPTCAVSCTPTSCGTLTYCAGQTCSETPTCISPPTCSGMTCSEPTCRGVSCSIFGDTCQATACGKVTCNGAATCVGAATCMGAPTCIGTTCAPANCPTSLSEIQVPRPGEIQLSFNSSSSLQYTLQYCTNLSSTQWLTATNAQGNGGTMTFFHGNNADVSFYRLLISQ